MSFEGKNVLVVGGSSGIGLATVHALLEKGANVWNASRRANPTEGVTNITWDVLNEFPADVLPSILHGLVYCPGTINLKPFAAMKDMDFEHDFRINVIGGVKAVRAGLKALKASSGASIVFFSTVAASQGMNYHASIASSKAAVEGLVISLASEFSRSSIRVNAIAPSLTDTPLAASLLATEEKRKASEDRHPIKELGNPTDMAAAVLFLLSSESRWMTGQVLHPDGGLSSIRPL